MNYNQKLIRLTFVIGRRRRIVGSLPFVSINILQTHAIIASSVRAICDGSAFYIEINKQILISYKYQIIVSDIKIPQMLLVDSEFV